MTSITVPRLPDEVLHAIRTRAVQHGQSLEAEVRENIVAAVKPERRVKLGTLLAEIGRRARLTDEELAVFETRREKGIP